MTDSKSLQKKLDSLYSGRVKAYEEKGILRLEGILDEWQEIVNAGQLCADKKSRRNVVNNIKLRGFNPVPMKMPKIKDSALDKRHYDAVIIGAGVVGCAIARELSRFNLKVLLIDKEHDVAMHASSRNDGMIHPGIDLRKNQLKYKYNMRGNKMYSSLCRELEVDYKQTGQYLGFSTAALKYIFPFIRLYFKDKGLKVSFLSAKKLKKVEPELSKEIKSALFFESAGIVCPYNLTIALAENAVTNGVELSLDTAVVSMELKYGKIASVDTNRGKIFPRVVINAAGVFSDDIAKMAGDGFFSIHPRKGTNAILDKKAAFQVKTIASLIGTSKTGKSHSKGGGLVSTIDENLLVGPNAFETNLKEDFSTQKGSIDEIFAKQKLASPRLLAGDIITCFSGVRAATYEEDFVIEKGRSTKNIVHAAGIQSPGLTAAPAIAQDIAKMTIELLSQTKNVQPNPLFNPRRKAIPATRNLSDLGRSLLIEKNPDYGIILCRCEEISRGEIIDALNRPVPCDTVDGVKRRVRPGMGRCQGGFCGPLVVKIISEQKNIPLNKVKKSGDGSELLFGSSKEVSTDE